MKSFTQIVKTIVAASALVAVSFSAHAETTKYTAECKVSLQKHFDEVHNKIERFIDPKHRDEFHNITLEFATYSAINNESRIVTTVANNPYGGRMSMSTAMVTKHDFGYLEAPGSSEGSIRAKADIEYNHVQMSPLMCDADDTEVEGVMFHEFGHFITTYNYPDYRRDILMTTPIKYTWVAQEEMANLMGGRMMNWTGTDATAYQAHLDADCAANGDTNSRECGEAREWKAGATF